MATNGPPDREVNYNPNIISTSQTMGLVYDLLVLKLLHVGTALIRVINGPQAESSSPLRWAISRRELSITQVMLETFFRYDTVVDGPEGRENVPRTGPDNRAEAGAGTGTVRRASAPVARAMLPPMPQTAANGIVHVAQEGDLNHEVRTAEGGDGASLTPSPLMRLVSTGSTVPDESQGSSEKLGVEENELHGTISKVPRVEGSSFTRPILNNSTSLVFDQDTEVSQTRSDYGEFSRRPTVNWIARRPVTDIEAHPIYLQRQHGMTEAQLVQERKRLKLWRSADDRFASADGLETGELGISRGMRIRSMTSVRPFSEV